MERLASSINQLGMAIVHLGTGIWVADLGVSIDTVFVGVLGAQVGAGVGSIKLLPSSSGLVQL